MIPKSDDDDGVRADAHFDKFAPPLGHMVLEFNSLEVDAGRMIARLLNQDDVVAGLFAGLFSFLEKLKLIKALSHLKIQDDKLKGEFLVLVKDATTINELRNRYIHAEYMPMLSVNDELIEMLHQRLKDHGKTMNPSKGQHIDDLLQPVDEEALKTLVQDIHSVAYRTRVLAEKFADSHP